MATALSPIAYGNKQEAQYKRQQTELKSRQKQHEQDYQTIVARQEAFVKRMKQDYAEETQMMENEIARKLNGLRNKHKQRLLGENQRLTAELNDLRAAHIDKVGELRETQEKQLKQLRTDHQDRIKEAELKLEKELAKYKTS